ncbi:serine/threonine-protein kinase [Pseudofrankia asymbiotica]|uniref:non-specific serine/threonine protein kinase n=1 Tax=Pseudofrankia asymbiotica TaxID=1834516 RepID=A0A1V2I8P4_9ACTN|nr:serine/threonine-protein kinase [Pseudofrankia asymbiotica]ONH28797.1 serine/threonine protein kinase [Pseudofrankia asymbiotica]
MPTLGAPDEQGTKGYLGGRYRLGRVIGEGGSGTVHEGEDVLLRRPVAIKEIRLPPMGSAAERDLADQRVMREARAAARLRHPTLVTVYDVLKADGRSWIVMEYVDGVSLSELIENTGRLAPERVARIGISLAYALEVAHRGGVVHRDVKPGNVMVTANGESRLTDFGIAVSHGDTTLTGAGTLIGSPAYIAPERVRGARAVYASDVWGLGATLFTAVEGEPPFEGKVPLAMLAAVVENRRRPFVHAGCLRGVIDHMLDVDPDRRPSLTQIRGHLREVLDDISPTARGRRRHLGRSGLARRPSRPREADRANRADQADSWLEILADSHRPARADDAGPGMAAGGPADQETRADGGDAADAAGAAEPRAAEVDTPDAEGKAAPTDVVAPTDIEPTDIEPTDIEPTDIEPTDIEPTDVEPTDVVAPTVVAPTDVVAPTAAASTDVAAPTDHAASAGVTEHDEGTAPDDGALNDNAERAENAAPDENAAPEAAAPGDAAAPGAGAEPAPPAARRRGSRRRVSLIVAAALASLLAVGTTLGLTMAGGGSAEPAAVPPPQRSSSVSPGPVTSPTSTTTPSSAATTGPSRPPSSAGGPPASGDTRTDAPPAQDYDTSLGSLIPTSTTPAQPPEGYTTRSGQSGWSVAVPSDWSTSPRGADRTVFAPASGYPELLVETQAVAGSSAIGAWQSLEGSIRANSPDYRRLSIRPADGQDGVTAAIWEFTFTSGGRVIHVLDLGVVRNGHGYALRWRMPQDEWDDQQALMSRIFATFRPGP